MQENPNLEGQVEDENNQYIETIKELKENTVPKEKYKKLEEENRKLLENVINGQPGTNNAPVETIEQKKERIKALKEDLAQSQEKGFTNLEYTKKALELREAVISLGKQDPFLPLNPTELDIQTANRVAEKLHDMVDEAKESPVIYRNLCSEVIRDDPKLPKKFR